MCESGILRKKSVVELALCGARLGNCLFSDGIRNGWEWVGKATTRPSDAWKRVRSDMYILFVLCSLVLVPAQKSERITPRPRTFQVGSTVPGIITPKLALLGGFRDDRAGFCLTSARAVFKAKGGEEARPITHHLRHRLARRFSLVDAHKTPFLLPEHRLPPRKVWCHQAQDSACTPLQVVDMSRLTPDVVVCLVLHRSPHHSGPCPSTSPLQPHHCRACLACVSRVRVSEHCPTALPGTRCRGPFDARRAMTRLAQCRY